MRRYLMASFILGLGSCNAQEIDSLNTAKNCIYMTADEREMIYEINRVRSNPRSYLQYLTPMLEDAKSKLKMNGKGIRNYSLTFSSSIKNGKEIKNIDTTWHYMNEERVKALTELTKDLKKISKLSVLMPDSGIYNAANKHATDQNEHKWTLMHTGTDGSMPWDRIIMYSPGMSFGNENIAGQSGFPTSRDIVLQLLIDEGIPGYGHRNNLLDPQWTHVACKHQYFEGMSWWIEDFGVNKKK